MKSNFEKKADFYKVDIFEKKINTTAVVCFEKDKNVFQGVKRIQTNQSIDRLESKQTICLDFGQHITGYFSFELEQYDKYLDAPVRIEFKFAETPYEMYRDFDSYTGVLCDSWLQREIISIDTKGVVRLKRRFAFRYVQIKVLSAPHAIILKNICAYSVSSADYNNVLALPSTVEKKIQQIDEVAQKTLAECMQEVFEDGPKRDRRMWIGDLRLQALVNYYTFGNSDLVKRCLYLFAALNSDERLLPSYLYTEPSLDTGDDAFTVSYALLYVVTLCDYYEHIGDVQTVDELFDVAKNQIDLTEKMLDKNGILCKPENYGWWAFIDWSDVRDITSLMGVFMYTIEKFLKLCKALDKSCEVEYYNKLLLYLREAALKHLYNSEEQLFVNKYDEGQYSVAAHVWMILGGVIAVEDAQRILSEIIDNEKFLQPVTPYMHHYVVEALFKAEMIETAKEYIMNYWGAMVELGADTFWEVFVKDNHFASPYGDAVINSSCHAWSCTPAYFIRKYKAIFCNSKNETIK